MNPRYFYEQLKTLDLSYEGTKNINGHKCHVQKVENVDLDEFANQGANGSFIPSKAKGVKDITLDARLYIDENRWVMRKMDMDMSGVKFGDKEKREAKVVTVKKDFRDVQGVLVAFKTETFQIKRTPKEKKKAKKMQKQMKKMEEKLENMLSEQREKIKKYMNADMNKAKSMMATGKIHNESTIKKVKVN